MLLSKLYGYQFTTEITVRRPIYEDWKASCEKDAAMLGVPEKEVYDFRFKTAQSLLLDAKPTQYYISKPVLELAKQIQLKLDQSFKWLYSIPDQTSQYNFDNSFIRFIKKDKKIISFFSSSTKFDEVHSSIYYDFLNIDLEKSKANIPQTDSSKNSYTLLLQLLSFIELSEIEEITLQPKKQHGYGSKKDPNALHNDNPFPIIVVNSRWAQRVYRPGEFQVRRHQRLQPKGPGRSEYELIWIESYVKGGITISAGKERQE